MLHNKNMYNSFWYHQLIQPPYTPPNWIFLPAWLILYILIFISFILYTKKRSYRTKMNGYILFLTQFILNICWTPAFFYYQSPQLAFFIIILLDITVLLTIIYFIKVDKPAGYLLLPYFLWIIFATYLNLGIIILN